MSPNVKCWSFNAETGHPIGPGCTRESCLFIHPQDKRWASAKSSNQSSYRSKMQRMEKQIDRERDRDRDYAGRDRDDRDRERDRKRERDRDKERRYSRTRDRTPEYSKSSRKDGGFDRDDHWSLRRRSESQLSASSIGHGWGFEDKAAHTSGGSGSSKVNDRGWSTGSGTGQDSNEKTGGISPWGSGNAGTWGTENNQTAWGAGKPSGWDSVEKAADTGAWRPLEASFSTFQKQKAKENTNAPPPTTSPPTWNNTSTSKSRKASVPPSPSSASPFPLSMSTMPDIAAGEPVYTNSTPKAPRAFTQRTAGPSYRKDSNSRRSSPNFRYASPTATEHTSISVPSSRKALKSRRVRKLLGLFDHAVKKEVERKTVAKKYERWKKIQESPQYGRVRLNGQKKLDNVRGQLKKRRDKLSERVKYEIKAIVNMIQPSASSPSQSSNIDIDELKNRVRARLDELSAYILDLKHILEEQKKTEEAAKEAAKAREAKEREATAAALSAAASSRAQEITLENLKTRIAELEVRSFEILDVQEEDRARFLSAEFIEEALEVQEEDSVYDELEDLEERIEKTGKQVSNQGMEISKLSSPERKEKKDALQKQLHRIARLKKELEAKVAVLDQDAIERREKIDDLSNQIQNLHNRRKPSHSYSQHLLPFVERLIIRIVEQELKPIIVELRTTTKAQVRVRQHIISGAIEKAVEPIVQMTTDIVQRSNALAGVRDIMSSAGE
ncbi:hypothetical protein C8R41DRAFT_982199 [Lentinula lateritia]|uniref:C3H1-type domain-containing protein n=1 Tax=Lentinula lateritia TaxID=40482 RepID=A0ABQ8VB93_9AGAR|nr:hypothetical protein C8R41DRAFT_982199 [Lentinula lateritia]